jgi:hypothetical protein
VKTLGKRVCQVCGTALSDDSESCPICALRGAFAHETESLSDVSSEFRFDQYRVLQNEDGTPVELGRGAMGITYKAFDVHLQCPVALKIINARYIGDASARSRSVRAPSSFQRIGRKWPSELQQRCQRLLPLLQVRSHNADSLHSAPESPADQMVDKQQDNGPYQ